MQLVSSLVVSPSTFYVMGFLQISLNGFSPFTKVGKIIMREEGMYIVSTPYCYYKVIKHYSKIFGIVVIGILTKKLYMCNTKNISVRIQVTRAFVQTMKLFLVELNLHPTQHIVLLDNQLGLVGIIYICWHIISVFSTLITVCLFNCDSSLVILNFKLTVHFACLADEP